MGLPSNSGDYSQTLDIKMKEKDLEKVALQQQLDYERRNWMN